MIQIVYGKTQNHEVAVLCAIVFEEELGTMPAIEQILTERGFSGFTIPYVKAGCFTGGDYFAEAQYTPSSVICTPRFSAPAGDEVFSKLF